MSIASSRYWPAIMLAALGLVWPGISTKAEPLTQFEQFRSYPYMDKGYRQARESNWPAVEGLMKRLLEQSPGHSEARNLLVQALINQERFAEAADELERLPGAEAQPLLMELRLAWIAHSPDIAARVESWLGSLKGAQRERLWVAYSQELAERNGEAVALDWLLSIPSQNDEAALRRWRATLAEATSRWDVVEEQLSPMRRSDQLTIDDWQRLALALVKLDQDQALEELIVIASSPEVTESILTSASEHAIATGRPAQAKQWLLRLKELTALSDDQYNQLLELAMQTDDTSLVRTLGRVMDVSCLTITYWLSEHSKAIARDQLEACDSAEDPQRWLVLAQQLEAEALLSGTSLPPRWEERRIALVTRLWQRKNQTSRALSWLAKQPQTAPSIRLRAELLQSIERYSEAAHSWERYYQQTGDYGALDQATYLYLADEERKHAKILLEKAFSRTGEQLPARVLDRLASLYAQEDMDLVESYAERLLGAIDGNARDMLLLRLANDGRCETVAQHTGNVSLRAAEWRALGTCAMPDRPGAAVTYYQQAVAAGDDSSRIPLAFSLQAADDPASAYQIWREKPLTAMTNAARQAAARSALGIGQVDEAEHYWASSDPEEVDAWQLGADIAYSRRRPSEALRRQRQALQEDPSAARYYAAANLAQNLGREVLSLNWLAQAVQLAPEDPRYRADYAFRLAGSDAREHRREAMALLEQSVSDYPEDFRLAESLALRYAEFGKNAASQHQLRRAIDLEQAPLAIEGESAKQLAQRRYRQRRMHETLSRRNTFTLTSTWSPAGVGTANIPTSSGDQNTQIAQWDHALGDKPIDNGRQVALYGRAVLDSSRRSHYGQTLSMGVGLRAKPFSTLNLNLYGEIYTESSGHEGVTLGELANPFGAGWGNTEQNNAKLDLLLRASASFLDQGKYRSDWRVDKQHWSERQLYLDAAWWLDQGTRQGIARYRQGYAFKLPTQGPQTLMPYAMLQFTTQETDGWEQDARMGLGLRFQHWFDADRYNAYRGDISLRVEYQQALGGGLYARDNGWLAGIEVHY